MDMVQLSEFINLVLIPVGFALAYKLKKLIPEKKEALETVDLLLDNSAAVVAVFGGIEGLSNSYKEATADDNITPEELKKMLGEIHELTQNPAIVDLRKLIEAKK